MTSAWPGPRGTVNLRPCWFPNMLLVGAAKLGRDCSGRPLLLTPPASTVVALPTEEEATECQLQFS